MQERTRFKEVTQLSDKEIEQNLDELNHKIFDEVVEALKKLGPYKNHDNKALLLAIDGQKLFIHNNKSNVEYFLYMNNEFPTLYARNETAISLVNFCNGLSEKISGLYFEFFKKFNIDIDCYLNTSYEYLLEQYDIMSDDEKNLPENKAALDVINSVINLRKSIFQLIESSIIRYIDFQNHNYTGDYKANHKHTGDDEKMFETLKENNILVSKVNIIGVLSAIGIVCGALAISSSITLPLIGFAVSVALVTIGVKLNILGKLKGIDKSQMTDYETSFEQKIFVANNHKLIQASNAITKLISMETTNSIINKWVEKGLVDNPKLPKTQHADKHDERIEKANNQERQK